MHICVSCDIVIESGSSSSHSNQTNIPQFLAHLNVLLASPKSFLFFASRRNGECKIKPNTSKHVSAQTLKEKIIIFVAIASRFFFFLEIDIMSSVEWKHCLLFLTKEMDVTHPELRWIKFPFVAVPLHRSGSLSGLKLIASWKHLIAAAVQDVCVAKRGIEFKQKRMRVVRFQFQCSKPSIIWHILRLNPFLYLCSP